MPALKVYLDSNDYSELADARRQSPATASMRTELQDLADSGAVRFLYSAAHITEMAPLDAQYTTAASDRSDLLVRLCDHNALVSFERLMAMELSALSERTGRPTGVYSEKGDWFPDLTEEICR